MTETSDCAQPFGRTAEIRAHILKLRWMGLDEAAAELARELNRQAPDIVLIEAAETD